MYHHYYLNNIIFNAAIIINLQIMSIFNSVVSDVSFSQVDRLKAELMYERRTSEEQLSRFEDERRVWQEEKEKVKRRRKILSHLM